MALRVRRCCCAVNLRTGTLLIGIIDFIGALTTLILTSMAAVNYEHYRTWWDSNNWWETHPMDDLQSLYITMAVISGVLLVADLLLIVGVSQAKPKLILPWVFYAYVSVLSNLVCGITYGVYSFDYYYDYYGYISVSWSLIYLAVKMYFLLVVWSFYKEMMETAGNNVTTYPQPFPNGPQTYPNGPPMYPPMQYPNGQMPYPNQPQPYPNSQQPFPNPQPLPSVQNMNRNV